MAPDINDPDPLETVEWLDSLDSVVERGGRPRTGFLLDRLIERGRQLGASVSYAANTPYINTIAVDEQPEYPGDRKMERRIKGLLRWNAIAMVVRANKRSPGLGGHIATYASAATLLEVAFNHFFLASNGDRIGDQVYFQGHASPGVYARAFLEGRLSREQLENFRRELGGRTEVSGLPDNTGSRVEVSGPGNTGRPDTPVRPSSTPDGVKVKGTGLSSYPHPWLMPDFWEFPTVSMGLSPIWSIYQARYNRYLLDRGIADTSGSRVWAFLGDGEMDEPESLGATTLASREGLNNLIWVINCNLQRLDGPVRGNGKIIQELEAAFRGAGWNVIKVIWGSDWDPLLAADKEGVLVRRMTEVVDGQYQKYVVEPGDYTRHDFFGVHPKLLQLVEHLSDDQIRRLRRGGHDPVKVFAAYKEATESTDAPTVILAKTVKGYGLGTAGEGYNIAHQKKELKEDELEEFRDRFDLHISDKKLKDMEFLHPGIHSPEVEYMLERRRALGGFIPRRTVKAVPLNAPPLDFFKDFLQERGGSEKPDKKQRSENEKLSAGKKTEVATTMAFVNILRNLMKDEALGKLIVPIVPDEARTFGMDALFRPYGIYAHKGQLYEPVDKKMLMYYREAKDGQLLEEGITEAGSMSSFTAAGTAYATHGINTIPFFIFYSMFGFQRIGDLIWAHADARGRGFLLGATAGRTTLNGEGLQHEDGHSHLLASTVPNCLPYDPAYSYELAVIIQDGIRRMYQEQESVFYYLTLYNEKYEMPAMPDGVADGILKGLYKLRPAPRPSKGPRVHLFGSGPLLRHALRAQQMLDAQFGVQADVWSVTSYVQLRRDALDADRWNLLHPTEPPRQSYLARMLEREPWPVIAVTDYMKALPDMIRAWLPAGLAVLGTDGFGRSDTREALRRHFEVDAEFITLAALHQLALRKEFDVQKVAAAIRQLGIDPEKIDPAGA